mmetsp:Transcript_27091/g.55487  ORF Transcript_27091/g.55487 Transcript_27091/m.55487 type:complete len:115 (+) Transcript_27091:93-437(+)
MYEALNINRIQNRSDLSGLGQSDPSIRHNSLLKNQRQSLRIPRYKSSFLFQRFICIPFHNEILNNHSYHHGCFQNCEAFPDTVSCTVRERQKIFRIGSWNSFSVFILRLVVRIV